MLKEIHEQPKAVQDTLNAYVSRMVRLICPRPALPMSILQNLERIYIVACGSAYHVGVAAKICPGRSGGYSGGSGSGFGVPLPESETGEKLHGDCYCPSPERLQTAWQPCVLPKRKEVPVLSVVNVVGSSIARESDYVLYTYAGPEISVATTKAYSTQLVAMYLLAVQLAKVRGMIIEERYEATSDGTGSTAWIRSRECWRTKSGSSGSQANMPMQKTFSSSDGDSIMPSAWKAA